MEGGDRRHGGALNSRRSLLGLVAVVLAAGALTAWWQGDAARRDAQRLAALARPGDIRMLSSETCVYCAAARRWMTEHRVAFGLDPTKYLPQYGGYCGYAASIDKISPVDPEIWQIVDGRLILQHTQQAYDLFNADLAANVKKADANWPGLVASSGRREGESWFARLLRRIGLS